MAGEQPDLDDPELLKRAAATLREIVNRDWRGQTKPVLVLRALCALEERGRAGGDDGWTAHDIAAVMAEDGDKDAARWVEDQDYDERVRNHWRTLKQSLWPAKVNAEDSALYQRFRDKGMLVYAEPQKERGGGRGKSNVYSLVLAELPKQDQRQAELASSAKHPQPRAPLSDVPEIEYLAEDVSIPKFSSVVSGRWAGHKELDRWLPACRADGNRADARPVYPFLGLAACCDILGHWLPKACVLDLLLGFDSLVVSATLGPAA